jgi:hypothetical protein
LPPLSGSFSEARRQARSVTDHYCLANVVLVVELIHHKLREVRPAYLPDPAVRDYPVVAPSKLVGVR